LPVARVISRRKHSKLAVKAVIANINRIETTRDKVKPNSAPKNKVTIDAQISRAETVDRLMAHWIKFTRRGISDNSHS
jgi:hypothetical protein